jgi:DNA-binding FrmR family transcriptional regulator
MTRQIGTRLSQKVAQKDRQKKAMNPIAHALGKLEGLDQMRDAVEETRAVVDQMRDVVTTLANDQHEILQAVAAIPYMVNDINGLIYENVKQRAVHVKVMRAVSEGPKFLIAGASRSFSTDQLVQMTEDYGVEYDFVYALICLAENYGAKVQDLTEGA